MRVFLPRQNKWYKPKNQQDEQYQDGIKPGLSWEQAGTKIGLGWDEVEKLFIALQEPKTMTELKELYQWSNTTKFRAKYVSPYRLSENFIVPYVDNVYPKDIIKKIIIGPCNDFERSTKSLQGWLHKIGMDHTSYLLHAAISQ